MMKLFFNAKSTKLKNVLEKNGKNVKIQIATAFFSDFEIIRTFVENKCTVQLIVRLDKGTSATELEKLLPYSERGQVEVRFFSDEHFHPKFYIFGDKTAFIGSSNLTHNGLSENQEMNIQIENKEMICELQMVFEDYWEQAKEFTQEDMQRFKEISSKYEGSLNISFCREVKETLGTVKYNEPYANENFMFYCADEGPHRNLDDFFNYDFISAGQRKPDTGYLYSKEIKRLKKGMYFFAYLKRKKNVGGYVGYGKILDDPVKIDDFIIDGKKVYELPLKQPGIKVNHDNEACEWLAKVEWIEKLQRKNALYYKGIFSGARHTVCKIDKKKHGDTLTFLLKNI